ncbi:hypothetical protein CK203_100837 [Vitis vinifera]|uniref:Uncharacterized protein n=1 Tax=Vitis vinifera TaxID=29760 RepID=A0A438DQM4_VITVI|nr:hypothetical protein CK203_100837 [Vitis vinifera]
MWEELAAVRGLWDEPWCLAGDFKVVWFSVEKSNYRQMTSTMREFFGFIDEFELVDLPLGGGGYTWSGGPVSDYFPIFFDCGGVRKGKRSFRFENMWLRVEALRIELKNARKDAALESINYWDNVERFRLLSDEDRRSQRKKGIITPEELKEGIGSYFKAMFEEPQARRPDVASELFMRIDAIDNEGLEGPFLEEVTKALSKLGVIRRQGRMGSRWLSGSLMAYSRWGSEGAFNILIAKAEEGGFIRGVKIEGRGEKGVQVSHLLFADGTLLFARMMRINCNIGRDKEDVDRAAVLFGCKVGRFPTSYQGLPFGAPHRSIGVSDVIDERFKRKLAAWKKQYLSKGGRPVLIKRKVFGEKSFLENLGRWREVGPLERCTRFWWGSWVGEIKLKDVYPTLFRLSSHKNAIVADLWGRGGGGGGCLGAKEVWGSGAPLKTPFFAWEADKTTLDIVLNNSWFGLGVLGFSEKSSPIMEIQGTRDEEKSSLAAGSDMLILVYSGRAQPKDL